MNGLERSNNATAEIQDKNHTNHSCHSDRAMPRLTHELTASSTSWNSQSEPVYLPENAAVTINNTKYSQGAIYLKPGSYNVTSTSEGFAKYTNTYTVSSTVTDPVLNIVLEPQSDEANNYYLNNQALYTEREGFGSAQAHQQSSVIIKESPLITKLPYNNFLYTIGYQADPTDPTGKAVIINIDAASGFRNAAVKQIKDLGYNPADYKIVFDNYQNPFTTNGGGN